MKYALLGWLITWAAATACLAAEPIRPMHCQSSDDRSCTEANGRDDAAYLIGRKRFGLMVWGGPAAPQPAMGIILDEYKKAAIEVWLIGDTLIMPGGPEDLYYKGFNEAMEKAIAAKRGPGYLERVRRRMDERIRQAGAAAKRKQ